MGGICISQSFCARRASECSCVGGRGSEMQAVMRRCSLFVVLTLMAVCLSAEDVYEADDAISMLEVTPQIPDGPVVQQFKKKVANEIEKQREALTPALDRADAKKEAKQQELDMMAEVVIKNRVAAKEQKLKKKERLKENEEKARAKIAKARRTERYVKLNEDKVQREKERLQKLNTHTTTAFNVIKKLFKRKKSTPKSAMEAMAKAKANAAADLTVGGYLDLKGNQINMRYLTNLNEKLAAAMKDPNNLNILFAQKAFKRATVAGAKEKEVDSQKETGWKNEQKRQQELVEKREQRIQNEKLAKLAAQVSKEKRGKGGRTLEISSKQAVNEGNEKKKWADAVALVKKQRQLVADNEAADKKKFLDKLASKEKEKKKAAPGELVVAKKKKYQERSEKYDTAQTLGPEQAATAKIMKRRACEEFKGAEAALENVGKPGNEGRSKQVEARNTKFCAN